MSFLKNDILDLLKCDMAVNNFFLKIIDMCLCPEVTAKMI